MGNKNGKLETDESEWIKQDGGGFWAPENVGDTLVGEIVEVKDGVYGKQYTLKKDDGKLVTPSSYKALQARMINAKVGDEVKIVYDGEEPPKLKGHSPMRIFSVFIKKQ